MRLLPIRAIGAGSGDALTFERIREALYYAVVLMGADVVNASWTFACGPVNDKVPAELRCTDQQRRERIDGFRLQFEDAGVAGQVVFVTGGPNVPYDLNPENVMALPAELDFPGLMTVASSTPSDQNDGRSSFGSLVFDLAAPGADMAVLSIDDRGTGGRTGLWQRAAGGVENLYLTWGTSYAVPQVAGTAALIISLDPDAFHATAGDARRAAVQEIADRIVRNADQDLPGLRGKVGGARRLNVERAVLNVVR